ncbi:MAG: sodium:solute symporter, partial [Treponema sp.]|nr:sodium:solute symporter [Treponema sp.]
LVFKNSLYSGVFTMLASIVIVPVVSLLTQKTRPEKVNEMFQCYDRKVTVQVRNVLTDEEK